jgi:uncharacterized membrane protein YccC
MNLQLLFNGTERKDKAHVHYHAKFSFGMKNKFLNWLGAEVKSLFVFTKSEKRWHAPFLAAACAGTPLLGGYFSGQLSLGLLLCTGSLVILYMPKSSLAHKMRVMLLCSLGFMISFAVGLLFGFNRMVATFVLTLFAFLSQFLVAYFRMPPPGNFLFVMVCAVAIYLPYDPEAIPRKVILLGSGSLLACLLALVYHVVFRNDQWMQEPEVKEKPFKRNMAESAILAMFIGISLAVADYFKLQKPYWIPVSCAAVMQGTDLHHVWQRGFQRMLGTLLGLVIAWGLLTMHLNLAGICLAITILQFVADSFISRHYTLVVVFFTPMAIFLAEAGSALQADPALLIRARFFDTLIGCGLGAVGGYVMYRQFAGRSAFQDLENKSG